MFVKQYNLDIVSATWATRDVTAELRDMYANDSSRNNTFTFEASTSKFGSDPIITNTQHKVAPFVLVVVWRVMLDDGNFSEFQVTKVVEGNKATINFDGSKLQRATSPNRDPNKVVIISAFWHDKDVKEQVQALADNTPANAEIKIDWPTLEANGVEDPLYLHVKGITITYYYISPHENIRICTRTGQDSKAAVFRQGPLPRLKILAAAWGGEDCTSEVISLIDPVTESIDVEYPSKLRDRWVGTVKSLAVLYQYEGYPLQLFVGKENGSPRLLITPEQPDLDDRKKYFNQEPRKAGELNIIAALWGPERVDQARLDEIKQTRRYMASNSWFRFDAWEGVEKAAVIFYQYGLTGEIKIQTNRENNSNIHDLGSRDSSLRDPLAGTGFLSVVRPDHFTLQLASPMKPRWLCIATQPSLGLSTTDHEDQAAVFALTEVAVGHDSEIPALAVRNPGGSGYEYYVRVTKESVNNEGVTIPPALELVNDPSLATEAHYELPAGGRSRFGLIISFNPLGTSVAHDPPILRYVPSTGAISVLPIFRRYTTLLDDKPGFEQCLFCLDFVDPRRPMPEPIPITIAGWLSDLPFRLGDIVRTWLHGLGVRVIIVRQIILGINRLYNAGTRAVNRLPGAFLWELALTTAFELYTTGQLWGFYRQIFESLTVSVLNWYPAIGDFISRAVDLRTLQQAYLVGLTAYQTVELADLAEEVFQDIEAVARDCQAWSKTRLQAYINYQQSIPPPLASYRNRTYVQTQGCRTLTVNHPQPVYEPYSIQSKERNPKLT
ncbi:hypothetical protein VTJ04DRAFT_7606 [Mycothermus thermophilus]|uniref:uncharacterized protein n=1 Tax=Humicola insolens TaxID=85995 RepID=UPI0037442861